MLRGYYCDDPEVMHQNDEEDAPWANEWVRFDEAEKLQTRVEKLEKALNKIAVGDDESDPYGYIPRDEFRDIAKQALKGGE